MYHHGKICLQFNVVLLVLLASTGTFYADSSHTTLEDHICVEDICYYLYNENTTWSGAIEKCTIRDMQLAMPDNAYKMAALDALARLQFDSIYSFWLGGERHPLSSAQWIDGKVYETSHSTGDCCYVEFGINTTIQCTVCSQTLAYLCGIKSNPITSLLEHETLIDDNKNLYIFGTSETSWFEARYRCLNMNGDLVVFDITDVSQLNQLAVINETQKQNYKINGFWIGLRAAVWRWISGKDFGFTNWRTSQSTYNESCLIHTSLDRIQGWNATNCTSPHNSHMYACESNTSFPESDEPRNGTNTSFPENDEPRNGTNSNLSAKVVIIGVLSAVIAILLFVVIPCLIYRRRKPGNKAVSKSTHLDTIETRTANETVNYLHRNKSRVEDTICDTDREIDLIDDKNPYSRISDTGISEETNTSGHKIGMNPKLEQELSQIISDQGHVYDEPEKIRSAAEKPVPSSNGTEADHTDGVIQKPVEENYSFVYDHSTPSYAKVQKYKTKSSEAPNTSDAILTKPPYTNNKNNLCTKRIQPESSVIPPKYYEDVIDNVAKERDISGINGNKSEIQTLNKTTNNQNKESETFTLKPNLYEEIAMAVEIINPLTDTPVITHDTVEDSYTSENKAGEEGNTTVSAVENKQSVESTKKPKTVNAAPAVYEDIVVTASGAKNTDSQTDGKADESVRADAHDDDLTIMIENDLYCG